jgi:hypothetical protein
MMATAHAGLGGADEEAMEIVTTTISIAALRTMAEQGFGDLVKAVVDIGRGVMVVGAEMHADEEGLLLDAGARQADLWGVNLYPEQFGTSDFIEFDSMINLRPRQGNRSRSVEDPAARQAIIALVERLVVK